MNVLLSYLKNTCDNNLFFHFLKALTKLVFWNKLFGSKNRVKAVANWLAENGIAPSRITSSYLGKQNPATSNESEGGRSGNRRVEIFIK